MIPLTVAQTLLWEVAQCVKALSEVLQLGPGSTSFPLDLCWTFSYGLQVTFQAVWKGCSGFVFVCLPITSHILLKVNFRSGHKRRHKGSTCSFLSASFFYLKNSCNARLGLSHLNSTAGALWFVSTAYLFSEYLLWVLVPAWIYYQYSITKIKK